MVDNIEMPQPGRPHDQNKRMIRYQYPDHDMTMDLRTRCQQLQQKCKNMAAEQAELQKKFERTMEEKDKVQEQSNYIYTQHSQLQAYAQKMNYDKEQVEKQLHRVRSEHDQKMSRLLDELNRARSDLECAIQDRDDYKYKVTELQRESQRLNEKVQSYSGIDYKSSRKEMDNLIEQNNHLRTSLKELKNQNENFKGQLADKSHKISLDEQEVTKLQERNAEITKKLDETNGKLRAKELELKRIKSQEFTPPKLSGSRDNLDGSDENVSSSSRFRHRNSLGTEDKTGGSYGQTFGRSISGSGGLFNQDKFMPYTHKKKLSSSASNLLEEGGMGREHVIPQLQLQLNKAFKDKEKLSQQLSDMRDSRNEMEGRLRSVESDNEFLKEELVKAKAESSVAHEHANLVKGVTIQQSTETFEKNTQLQTQLLELQTERTLIERQRDIALLERDRVLTDALQVKKKLEAIKSQRQKDAKELASMRKLKDKTVFESQDAIKKAKELTESAKKLQEQNDEMISELKSIAENSSETEIKRLLSSIKQEHLDYKAMLKCLYGRDSTSDVSSATALRKLEGLFHEKSNLIIEVQELQRSASKQNEDYIFDLKQTIESLYIEQDQLQNKNRSYFGRVEKLEIERDKLRQECERLDKQCQELNASLTFPSATANNTSVEPIDWGENWETKHVQVPLDIERKAGFSVVGGKDQPQLPNPGAFIVTTINKGGAADGILRVGDILENINGCNLTNADHSHAVAAVKESKGVVDIVLKRRKNAHALQVGLAGTINRLGEVKKIKEPKEFALMLQKDGTGFTYDWETQYVIKEINESGPAANILQIGDRIMQVNSAHISKEKPNSVKKLMKPHKGILRLVVEREIEDDYSKSFISGSLPPQPISELLTPKKTSGASSGSDKSSVRNMYKGTAGGSSWDSDDCDMQNSQDHSRHRTSYHSVIQDSDTSQEPVKIEGGTSGNTRLRSDGRYYNMSNGRRPNSDGLMYVERGYNERKVGFEETSSEIGSTEYSESIAESFLSEPSTCPEGYPMDSSQTSIELTFHSISQVSHNRLTVQSTISTQPEKDIMSDDDESYFARDDGTRTTFRTRSGSEGTVSQGNSQYQDFLDKNRSLKRSSKSSGRTIKLNRVRKGLRSGSLSQLSEPEYDQYLEQSDKKKNSRSNSLLAIRGRSRSNLSLTPARSMTSVQEEPRRSTSSTSVQEREPLADATYIRANFSYIPRFTQELNIKPGDVFHIIEDAPIRHRRAFWVSRLNEDGTDAGVGAIPNTSRAQEWLNEQGNYLDIALYEEVEAFTGVRPVLICGVLASQITNLLAESYPKLFHYYHPEFVEGTARINEARLHREQSEGRIIHYERQGDTGFGVIRREAFTTRDSRGKHVLVAGNIASLHALKSFAPPISILVKAGAEDSINTFSPDKLSLSEVQKMYADAKMLEEEHGHQFTARLMLVFEDTLLRQIADIVKHEKMNQMWVPVNKEAMSP